MSADFADLYGGVKSALSDILGGSSRRQQQPEQPAYDAYMQSLYQGPAGGVVAPAPLGGAPDPAAMQALYTGPGGAQAGAQQLGSRRALFAGPGETDDRGVGGFLASANLGAYAAKQQAKAEKDAAALSGKGREAVEAGDWSGPATADDNATLTPEKIDAWIASTRPNSPLRGKGSYILQVANQYGVSAPLLMGIFLKESELGTTAGAGFNLAGVGGEGNFAQYGSWEQAIDGAARNLGGPTYKGKSAQDQIGMWFVGKTGDLNATDSTGGRNGTVGTYLNGPVAQAYGGLGVPFNQAVGGTRKAGGPVPPSEIASRAQQWVGKVGYTPGGIRSTGNIADGADCSSFAGWLIGADQRDWNAQTLYDVSAKVQPGELRPGDLVFFDIANAGDPTARPVGHVAVWLGNGKIAQSTTLNGTNGVQIISLPSDSYLVQHIYGYGRYRARAGGNR